MTAKIINRVIANMFNQVDDIVSANQFRFDIKATIKLITENPELFSIETTADSPVVRYSRSYVSIASRALNAEFEFDIIKDEKLINPLTFEDEMLNTVVDEVTDYIRAEQAKGNIYIMYVPIISTRSISSSSYQPVLRFKTRYGLVTKGT